MQDIHISLLSELFSNNTPSGWDKLLVALGEKKKNRHQPYQPLRNAICAELELRGTGQRVLIKGLAKLRGANAESIRAKSEAAFTEFKKWYPKHLTGFGQSFLGFDACRTTVPYNGHNLSGNFHVMALNRKGEPVYIYFHCSDWVKDREDAFIQLLGVIAAHRYSAKPKNVWFVDLTTGNTRTPATSSKRLHSSLTKILSHLTVMQKGLAS